MDNRSAVMREKVRAHRLSRRAAIHNVGGGIAVAAAALAGGRVALAAAPATPVAGSTGLYASVRRYQLAPGKSMDELVRLVETGFVPILRAVPGFVEYYLIVDAATGAQVSVSVFRDRAAAEESTRRAAAWVAANVATFNEGPPEVTTGTIRVHAATTGTPAT